MPVGWKNGVTLVVQHFVQQKENIYMYVVHIDLSVAVKFTYSEYIKEAIREV